MPRTQAYKEGPRNKVQRYRTRAIYDYDFIHDIFNTASVVTVAFPPSLKDKPDPFPAVLPMIGVMARYHEGDEDVDEDDKSRDLYLHGYVSSRIMRLSNEAEENSEQGDGLPLTASATLVDGLVLSLTPNSHSYNYRSAVLQGYGSLVTDEDEKMWAMQQVTNSVVDQRWENTRLPPTPTEMTSTNILKVRIISASGKKRHGQPHDDKHDMENKEMRSKVWTGVVPIWEHRGAPLKGDTEDKNTVPDYINQHVESMNKKMEDGAMEALKE